MRLREVLLAAAWGRNEPSAARCDDNETGLLFLLWCSRELRLSVDVAETVRLFQDERLKEIAAALLMGESPDTLERRWLEMDEHFPLSAVAAGGNFCDTIAGTAREKWDALSRAQRRRRTLARYEQLRERLFRGQASPEELAEYAALAAELKRQ